MSAQLRNAGRRIFAAALQAVDVRAAVRRRISVHAGNLMLGDQSLPLADLDGVLVIALGKAAVSMYEAAADALSEVAHEAVVVAPAETLPGSFESHPGVAFLPGAHPTPTSDSLRAADLILAKLTGATERTAVLFLISGGASAMVEQPLDRAITLADLAVFSRALVGSGLDITAMNTLRKHLSAVKGGRLALAAAAARMQCTLLISDVPAASPDAIASGPSLPDSTTVAQTRILFQSLRATTVLPASVCAWFESAAMPETPKATDAAFARSHWEVLLSGDHLALAAAAAAEIGGFHAVVDNTCDDWEYREAARYLLDRSATLSREHGSRTCLISVGEIGVNVPVHAGEGGRNQHFALWSATELSRRGESATVLSAGSDGIDGHSNAAGAVCDERTFARAAAAGLNVEDALKRFDSAPLLWAVGDAIHTGPTGSNLRDLRLILTD